MIIRRRYTANNIVALRGSIEAATEAAEVRADLDKIRAILRRRTDEIVDGNAVLIGFMTNVEAAEFMRLVSNIRRYRKRAE